MAITLGEAARLTGLGKTTLARAIKAGRPSGHTENPLPATLQKPSQIKGAKNQFYHIHKTVDFCIFRYL